MCDTLRKLYGAGIIFLLLLLIPNMVIGLPILYYGIGLFQNMVMNILGYTL